MQALLRLTTSLALFSILCAPSSAIQTAGSETTRVQIEAADSMQRKVDFLKRNATLTPADPRPTVFSQTEINAYFAQRRVPMPEGVKSVTFTLETGEVTARTHVDFDELTAKARSNNPLLAIFSGTHDVQVVATADGSEGTAHVSVKSVALDGVGIPRMALEMFIERFVNPKFPTVRLDGDYKLPVRIDTVQIGHRTGTVTQK
ncbi:MAG: hypothetical protein JWO13_2081 [Acidobacteriales bacterium]|nr:hypothetical protein [Terriglobales bacterium]